MADISITTSYKEVEWKDATIKIRKYPGTRIIKYDDPEKANQQMVKILQYCIISWENITANGNPLLCNTTNKNMILDWNNDLSQLLLTEILEMMTKEEEEIKN